MKPKKNKTESKLTRFTQNVDKAIEKLDFMIEKKEAELVALRETRNLLVDNY